MPGCNNWAAVLSEFSRQDTSRFCLAHLLTNRDTGCVAGLAFVPGLCRRSGNTAWTKVDPGNREGTLNIMVSRNFVYQWLSLCTAGA